MVRVMKNSNQAGRFSELAHEWPVILLFFFLAVIPPLVAGLFGRGWGWGLITAVVAFAAWLLIRPWRFKCLSEKSRRSYFIFGTAFLTILTLSAGTLYWFMTHMVFTSNPDSN
jgi:hypothetical protein